MAKARYSLCAKCSSLRKEHGNFYHTGTKDTCDLPYFHICDNYKNCTIVLACSRGRACDSYICLLSHNGELRGEDARQHIIKKCILLLKKNYISFNTLHINTRDAIQSITTGNKRPREDPQALYSKRLKETEAFLNTIAPLAIPMPENTTVITPRNYSESRMSNCLKLINEFNDISDIISKDQLKLKELEDNIKSNTIKKNLMEKEIKENKTAIEEELKLLSRF